MNHAENIHKVYALMADLNVSLYDLELLGHIEDRDDLNVSADEAFAALLAVKEFDAFGDNHAIEHYHATSADYVSEALTKAGLLDEEDEEPDGADSEQWQTTTPPEVYLTDEDD